MGGTYCPSGKTLSDGLCDIEFMIDVNLKIYCDFPVRVETASWGQIKSLYR